MQLPALWLAVTAREVAEEPDVSELLGAAVASGATAVVLRDDGKRWPLGWWLGFLSHNPGH